MTSRAEEHDSVCNGSHLDMHSRQVDTLCSRPSVSVCPRERHEGESYLCEAKERQQTRNIESKSGLRSTESRTRFRSRTRPKLCRSERASTLLSGSEPEMDCKSRTSSNSRSRSNCRSRSRSRLNSKSKLESGPKSKPNSRAKPRPKYRSRSRSESRGNSDSEYSENNTMTNKRNANTRKYQLTRSWSGEDLRSEQRRKDKDLRFEQRRIDEDLRLEQRRKMMRIRTLSNRTNSESACDNGAQFKRHQNLEVIAAKTLATINPLYNKRSVKTKHNLFAYKDRKVEKIATSTNRYNRRRSAVAEV